MTNNIEKMYELAGIEKDQYYLTCSDCEHKTEKHYDEGGIEYMTCERLELDIKNCPHKKEHYPPFTDTKQLELIKWLAFEKRVSIKFINGKWYLYTAEMGIGSSAKYEPFEQLLAYLICNLWNNLTDEQREKVKGILK